MVNSAQNKIKKYFKEKNLNVFTNFTLAMMQWAKAHTRGGGHPGGGGPAPARPRARPRPWIRPRESGKPMTRVPRVDGLP